MDPRTRPTAAASSGDASLVDKDRGFVTHVTRPCPCDPCLQMRPADCLVRRLFKNSVGTSELERRKGVMARAATRSKVTAAWTKEVKPGTVIVVRVHSDEVNEFNEPYYLAVAAGKGDEKLVWRNNKTQMIDGNVHIKNTWLVRFRWLHYCPTAQPPADDPSLAGARGYQFQPGEATVVFPATGVVTKIEAHSAAQQLVKPGLSGQGAHRWLPADAHDAIVRDGMDLLS